MKLIPLQDKVLVRRLEAEEKSAGGIIIPDAAKEKPQKGKIVAVGSGRVGKDGNKTKLTVKKGDFVIFTSYAGSEVKFEGDEYLIMTEDDILAVIK